MFKFLNMKHIFLFLLVCLFFLTTKTSAQSLAINTDGSNANASALLDVKSTAKGVLVPRMSRTERDAIASPATGLVVFQTDGTAGFYYYTGAAWRLISPWVFSGTNIAFPVGSVGINLTTPTRTLDVNGTARIGANGTTITNIIKAAITQTIGAIAARSIVTVNFAIANVATGSSVIISPSNALPANGFIAYARVSAAGNVQAVFANLGAAGINLVSNTYYITVIQ